MGREGDEALGHDEEIDPRGTGVGFLGSFFFCFCEFLANAVDVFEERQIGGLNEAEGSLGTVIGAI